MVVCGGYGGGPRQTFQILKNLMESNDGGAIFVGRRMSIASKRAKERQKRTPDELVMAKTVKLGTLKLGGAVVPLVSGSTAWKGGSAAWDER